MKSNNINHGTYAVIKKKIKSVQQYNSKCFLDKYINNTKTKSTCWLERPLQDNKTNIIIRE